MAENKHFPFIEKYSENLREKLFTYLRGVLESIEPATYKMQGKSHSYESKAIPLSYLEKIFFPLLEKLPPGASILDIGAGKGEIAGHAEKKGFKTVSIDPFESGLKVAREKGQDSVRGLGDELPFMNASFDCVHIKDALVHVSVKSFFFKEVLRVLKPGGKLIITSADCNADIGGYYITNAEETREQMSFHGFENIVESMYRPKLREFSKDWYGYRNFLSLAKRFVLIAQKPEASIEESSVENSP